MMPAIPIDRIVASSNTRRLGERDCNRRSRERDRPAAVTHGLVDRRVDVWPRTTLFSEAADHQEAVVDAEPDPQHDHDVEGVHGHIRDGRDAAEREHRREDAAEHQRERESGREQAAEHDDHDDDRDRERQQLGPFRVLLGELGELFVDQQIATNEHPGASMSRMIDSTASHGGLLGAVVERRLQLDCDPGNGAVVARTVNDARDARRRLERGKRLVGHRRTLDDGDDRLAARRDRIEAATRLLRLERRRIVEVGLEGREQHSRGHEPEQADERPDSHDGAGPAAGDKPSCRSMHRACAMGRRMSSEPGGIRPVHPWSDPRVRPRTRK